MKDSCTKPSPIDQDPKYLSLCEPPVTMGMWDLSPKHLHPLAYRNSDVPLIVEPVSQPNPRPARSRGWFLVTASDSARSELHGEPGFKFLVEGGCLAVAAQRLCYVSNEPYWIDKLVTVDEVFARRGLSFRTVVPALTPALSPPPPPCHGSATVCKILDHSV